MRVSDPAGPDPAMTRPMVRIPLALGITLAVGCHEGAPAPASPDTPPPGAARSAPMPMESVHDQMHDQFVALKGVHSALIAGDLATARRHGADLQRLTASGDLGSWEDRVSFVRARADELVAAETPGAARRVATNLATYCADCHMVEAKESVFVAGPMPDDDGSLRARMARHEWAAESLWLGLIAPSSDRWREGLTVIAAPPAAPEAISADPARRADFARLGQRLSDLSKQAAPLPGQGDRAEAFADIMDVCAACHAISRPR